MNSKITALFAVAVMVTAGFVLVADTTGTDAKVVDNDYNAITISAGVSHNVTLYTDEYQYKNYGYTLKWYIAANPGAYSDQVSLDKMIFTEELGTRIYSSDDSKSYVAKEGVTISGVTFKMTERQYTSTTDFNNVGEYNLNISAANRASGPGYVAIKCDVSVNMPKSEPYKVESLYYLYQITVQDNQPYTLDEMTFTKGINDSIPISNEDSDLDVSDYYWYATGLPAGLSMDLLGNVSGTPHDTAITVDSVTVVGTSKTDSTKTVDATLKVNINDGSTYGIVVRLSGDVQAITDAKQYVTESGTENVTLTVNSSGPGPYDVLTVRIVDKGGNTHIIDGSQDNKTTFSIAAKGEPISGTGIYRIYVTAVVDSEKQTEYIDLYVLGNLDSVFAEIIVSGA